MASYRRATLSHCAQSVRKSRRTYISAPSDTQLHPLSSTCLPRRHVIESAGELPMLRLTSFFWYNKSQKGAIYYLPRGLFQRGPPLPPTPTAPSFRAGRRPLISGCFRVLCYWNFLSAATIRPLLIAASRPLLIHMYVLHNNKLFIRSSYFLSLFRTSRSPAERMRNVRTWYLRAFVANVRRNKRTCACLRDAVV